MTHAEAAVNRAPLDPTEALLSALNREFGALNTDALVAKVAGTWFKGRIALVSSFGAESAVLLHLAAEVDRSLPVIFIDTGKLFGETKRYRDALVDRLGLEDVRTVGPEADEVRDEDPTGTLWMSNPERCCHVRKVLPLERALTGFDAWFTGRKRYQGGLRRALPTFEVQGGRVKVNPLAGWNRETLIGYLDAHDLPRHPLEEDGFLSIGCMPCTERVEAGQDVRAGRWAGRAKTECGIHLGGVHSGLEAASPIKAA